MGNTLITRKQPAIELETARKRAEEALKESEAFNSSLLESAPNPIVVINIDASIRYINPACEKLTGFTLDEVAGRKIPHPWWPEEDKEEISASIKVSMGSSGRRVERIFQKKNGERFWVELNMAPIMHNGIPEYYLANWFDITERKKREKLQHDENYVLTLLGQGAELSELLNAIVRLGEYHDPSIKGSVLLFDSSREQLVQASAPSLPDDYKELFKEGIPIGPNAGSCGTAAYLKKRVIVPDIENSPLFKALDEVVKRTIRNGLLSCCSEPIIASSGELLGTIANYGNKKGEPDDDSLRVLEWSARIAAIAIERKRAEEALRESEGKFSRAFGASPNSMSITTFKDGIFLEVNDSFTRDNGYTREEVIGRSSRELNIWVKLEERDRILELLRKCGKAENEEYLARTKSGEIRTMLFSAEPINVDGKPCIIAVTTDITERKRVEEALKESESFNSSLLESSPNPIVVINPDTSIVYVNPAFEKLTGFTSPEIAGREAPYPWWLEENKKELLTGLKEFVGNESLKKEEIIQSKNGERFYVEINMVSLRHDGALKYYLSNWVDITGRKQAQETMANEAIRRRILIEQSLDGIVVLDENSKVYEANRRFAEMLGYSAEEVRELHTWDWDTQWTREELLEMGRNVDEAGYHLETYHRRKDGTTIDVEISINGAVCVGQKLIFCVCRDITERKRAEETMANEAIRRRILIEQSSDGIVILNENGKVYEANRRFAEMLGYSFEEVLQLYLWDWGDIRVTQEQALDMLRSVSEAGDHFETYHRRKDGTIVDVEISTNGATFAGQKLVFCVCRDITERKKAEEALRESEEKFYKAFSVSPDIISIVNLEDNKFIEVNDSFTRYTGYTRKEIFGHTADEVGIWAKAEERDRILRMLRKKGRVSNEEIHTRTKSGEIRTGLFSAETSQIGGALCSITVMMDITERKQAEEALRVSEEKYHAIFEQASDSIVLIETETGTLVDFNDRAYENLGYNREEFAKLKIYDIDVIETPEASRKRAENIYKGKIDIFETKLRAKDGDIRDILVSTRSLNIGDSYYALCVWHDITGRKRAEIEIKRALSNLEHANAQLAVTNKELEAFSYSVSHDLRAPLRSIDGFSQALLEDYMDKLDESGQDYLGRLRAASQKMGELIDGMLKLSRLTRSEIHREKVDMSALAEEIATRLQEAQPERQAKFIIGRGLGVRGDRQLLRVLLENLLGNAWKFTGKCQQAKIEFGATRNGGKKAYFVRDNGAGFDMAYADKLFGAFQRLHDTTEFPGTGIGLATVQRIIHRHGGSVWAEGAEGEGATFYFTLG